MIRVEQELLTALQATLDKACEGTSPAIHIAAAFESPKVASHGDLACTAALQLSKALKQNPREELRKSPRDLGEQIQAALMQTPAFQTWVEGTEIAGPGFINIRLKPVAKQSTVTDILREKEAYGHKAKTTERVLVEFVSANPTGPLHVGHGRQAALGDAICNLLATQGLNVYREFYYNDAGVQIETLAKSTQLRALGFTPESPEWPQPVGDQPAAVYNGNYIADIADDFKAKATVSSDDRAVTATGDIQNLIDLRDFAVAYLRREQDLDLKAFGVKFDNFYLESSLYTSGRVDAAVKAMIDSGKTFEEGGALWLKSTDFGDDKDRVMRKSTADGSDGGYTYFVPDVAYHIAKFERGFTRVINIQGTDHHGTIARVRAGLQAASGVLCASGKLVSPIPQGFPDYVLHTMVRVIKGGVEVKISKRAGSYVTLRDLIEWTSADAVRFFLLSRKPDTEYTFDVDLAVKKNNDNPVYYVQYAHARICSVLRAFEEAGGNAADITSADLSPLDTPAAQSLMLVLAKYPKMIAAAARDFAPHDVTFYLRDLAAAYHSYYDAERILVEDLSTKLARLALVSSSAQVLKNGLALLGVSAPDRM